MARAARCAAIAVLSGCGVLAIGAPSAADTPTVVGWWTTLNVSNPLPVGPGAISLASEPDVPKGGMLVEGGLSAAQPIAFGALSYFVPDGVTVTRLDLKLALPLSVPTTALHVCPLKISTFPADAGGPTNQAPPYDCSKPVAGVLSADASHYSFATGGLVKDGVLAVAILPDRVIDRAVFAAPGADTVVTAAGPSPQATPTSTRPAQLSPTSRAPLPTSAPAPAAALPAPVDTVALPGIVTAADAPGATPPVPQVAGPAAASPAAPAFASSFSEHPPASPGSSSLGALIALGLVAVGAGSWTAAARSARRATPSV